MDVLDTALFKSINLKYEIFTISALSSVYQPMVLHIEKIDVHPNILEKIAVMWCNEMCYDVVAVYEVSGGQSSHETYHLLS